METREEVEEYWEKKALELGERILYKSIAQGYQAGVPDRTGILFLTGQHLFFEYGSGSRKSILEVLLTRRKSEGLDQVLNIPRKDIRMVELVNHGPAKRWLRKGLDPESIMISWKQAQPSTVRNFLAGTYIGICTDKNFLAFDTPSNREWITRLS